MGLYRKATPKELAEAAASVNTEPPRTRSVNTDRHKPGYMAEYMRKRRAKKRENRDAASI